MSYQLVGLMAGMLRDNFSDRYRGSACVLSKTVTGAISKVTTLRRDIIIVIVIFLVVVVAVIIIIIIITNSKSVCFEAGWVTLSTNFRRKGASPNNHCWCQKTRVIAVLCVSAVHHLVLSQYTHLTDRQTDGWTDGRTELRQQYRALHYMPHGKSAKSSSPVSWLDLQGTCVWHSTRAHTSHNAALRGAATYFGCGGT